jgi:hypothetical protein
MDVGTFLDIKSIEIDLYLHNKAETDGYEETVVHKRAKMFSQEAV